MKKSTLISLLGLTLITAMVLLKNEPRFPSAAVLLGFSSLALLGAGISANTLPKSSHVSPLLLCSAQTLFLGIVTAEIGHASFAGIVPLLGACGWFVLLVFTGKNETTPQESGKEGTNVRVATGVVGVMVVFALSIMPIAALLPRWRVGVVEPGRSPADIALFMMAGTALLFAYLSVRVYPRMLRTASASYWASICLLLSASALAEGLTTRDFRVLALTSVCLIAAWIGTAIAYPDGLVPRVGTSDPNQLSNSMN